MRGDMRDRMRCGAPIKGMDVIFHLAARVGVGQSMYEIEDYMGENTQGTAVLLQSLLDTRAEIEKLVVASSMSIYGEGKYDVAQHGAVAPHPRSNEQLKRRKWEMLCPRCGSELTPLATTEDKPLQATSIYALVQEGPGRDVPAVWSRVWAAGGGVALLQHLWHAAGAFESLHRSGCDLRLRGC